jgi:hypothetical protein
LLNAETSLNLNGTGFKPGFTRKISMRLIKEKTIKYAYFVKISPKKALKVVRGTGFEPVEACARGS